MSTPTPPPALGTPERPDDRVDITTIVDTCTYCKTPIYEGEGIYTCGPTHWCCKVQRDKDFDTIPSQLAKLRAALNELKR